MQEHKFATRFTHTKNENILDYVAVKSAITANPHESPYYITQLVAPAQVIKELLQERIGGLLQKLLCITCAGAAITVNPYKTP